MFLSIEDGKRQIMTYFITILKYITRMEKTLSLKYTRERERERVK